MENISKLAKGGFIKLNSNENVWFYQDCGELVMPLDKLKSLSEHNELIQEFNEFITNGIDTEVIINGKST